jgi:predicted 3-demethylubiquinone-9 3-methyltransferase (glyoxalase superfamily)
VQKITPMLWFDKEAEEAATLYTSIFKNSSIGQVSRYGDHGPGPKGQAMTVSFIIDGQSFTALNGGPRFQFNEAISLVVNCDSQAEIDEYWDKLTADGGKDSQCGWLKDKFGLSWQIVPSVLPTLAMGPNGDKVMGALMKMVKLDIAILEKAAAG